MKETPETAQNTNDSLASAQLEKLRLEIEDLRSKNNLQVEKLQLEIIDLKGKNKWADRAARYIPLLSVLITVAGFCFGVYQFRAQQKDNEARLVESHEIESTKARHQKIEKQLTEFYYPIALRLGADFSYWVILRNIYGYYRKQVVTTEREAILANEAEILKIIYSHPDVMENNPKLKEEIFHFVDYAE